MHPDLMLVRPFQPPNFSDFDANWSTLLQTPSRTVHRLHGTKRQCIIVVWPSVPCKTTQPVLRCIVLGRIISLVESLGGKKGIDSRIGWQPRYLTLRARVDRSGPLVDK